MSEVIVITSGKGGVGKTTTTANLGVGLSKLGKKVILLDTDIGLRNLDIILGIENSIVYDIVDVVNGNCELENAIIADKRFDGLFMIPAAQTKEKTAVTVEQMKDLCDRLKTSYDFVLIDCPAGIEQGFKNAVAGADKAVVVAIPEPSSIRDADRIIGLLEENGLNDYLVLINRVRPDMVRSGDMMNVDDVIGILNADLIGVIPDDPNIIISANKGEPVVTNPKALAGQGYRNVAERLCGNNIPLIEFDKRSIRGKLKKVFIKKQ